MVRSVCGPICAGLGAAAVLTMGAAVPLWADASASPTPTGNATPTASPKPPATPSPTPSPSESATPTAPPKPPATPSPTPSAPQSPAPEEPGETPSPSPTSSAPELVPMGVRIDLPAGGVFAGEKVTVTVRVTAEKNVTEALLALTASGRPAPALSRCAEEACELGGVGKRGKRVEVELTVPEKIKGTRVRLTAEVTAKGGEGASAAKVITVRRKPAPTPSPSESKGGSGGQSGSSDGGTAYTPPTPSGDFTPPPRVELPQVSPPRPELAPGFSPAPIVPPTALRGNDLQERRNGALERLAGAQAAWLSALGVAFSLLLIRLRLGGRRAVAAGAVRRGAHRRPRRPGALRPAAFKSASARSRRWTRRPPR